jgi:lysine---8-amino-7-oxononanoate aminotransferase
MNLSYQKLCEMDKMYVWHPFTQMKDYLNSNPVIIARGDGLKLIDVNGMVYYDGVSSIWLNVHGHGVPEIDSAIKDQLSRIAHSTLLGLANIPSIILAEKLIQLSPPGLAKVFYSDSGSEAVEIGLKIAYQYWRLKGADERKSFVAMTSAYHGDTLGATSVGGMDLFHATYKDLLFQTFRVPYPDPYRFDGSAEECSDHCLTELRNLLINHEREIAGLIVEPLVQGAAGMIMMPNGFMKRLEDLCRHHRILLLADEVATGFGKTGKMFACDHERIAPDIMMIGKGLTGGYLPLAATLTSERIYSAFLGDYKEKKTFFHGHSYTGNQLACAAAIASINLFKKNNVVAEVDRKSKIITSSLNAINDLSHVGEVRVRGFMVGIELVKNKLTKEPYAWEEKMGTLVCDRSRELGMIIRPLGNVVVFMPPLVSSEYDLDAMINIIKQAIIDVTG